MRALGGRTENAVVLEVRPVAMDAILCDAVREGDDAHRSPESLLEQAVVRGVQRKRNKVLQDLRRSDGGCGFSKEAVRRAARADAR